MAAVDTSVTVRSAGGGEVGLANNIQILSRRINCATAGSGNLASGDWFNLFTLPAGALVLQGLVKIHTVDAGGGTVALGTGGGNELMTAMATSSAICQKLTNANVQLSTTAAATVSVVAGSAALTTADFTVTLYVAVPGGEPAAG